MHSSWIQCVGRYSHQSVVPVDLVDKEGGVMRTLEEHNIYRMQQLAYREGSQPCPNGIECPKCRAELFDARPGILLLSNPAQMDIVCPVCKYTGYRVA
jgi:hypothetical protein